MRRLLIIGLFVVVGVAGLLSGSAVAAFLDESYPGEVLAAGSTPRPSVPAEAPAPSLGAWATPEQPAASLPVSAAPSDPSSPVAPAPSAAPALGVESGPLAGEQRAFVRRAPDPSTLRGYVWPLRGARLTLPFGPSVWGSRVVNGRRFHDGIDLATFCGDRIVAAHAGVVLAAGRHYDRAMGWVGDLSPYFARLSRKQLWTTLPNVVIIDDGNGYRSIYAHFSRVVVRAGQRVRGGQLIGYEGRTGRASGCHLHFGLFSPDEFRLMGVRPDVGGRMLVPPYMILRVDPLIVLPLRAGRGDPKPKRYSMTRETLRHAAAGST